MFTQIYVYLTHINTCICCYLDVNETNFRKMNNKLNSISQKGATYPILYIIVKQIRIYTHVSVSYAWTCYGHTISFIGRSVLHMIELL